MTTTAITAETVLNREAAAPTQLRVAEDQAMIRTAARLTRDLHAPRAAIYWADFLASALTGYAATAGALFAGSMPLALLCAGIAILALYRAGSFIHELTHLRPAAVPGFKTAWNMLIGVPLLIPSFMYDGVHNLHHMPRRYGTKDDPEYLPLALMKPWTVPLFVVVSALAPLALIVRYGLLAPLSAVIPPLRRMVVARYSGLVINPEFRRRPAEGAALREWRLLETFAAIWAMGLIIMIVSGIVPLRAAVIVLAIVSGTMMLNQVRTLAAHLWANDGEVMGVTAQYLDSVNVPPPASLPALWAPVGLRYHALHHLLPGLPYHALGEAHRRITAELAPESRYHEASYRSLSTLIGRLVASTLRR
ncbi:MAG: fatty acid desaturase [Parasphingorhabdus sp.]|nr:fatty acid desaturase [Parasphingorhabdus sp.]